MRANERVRLAAVRLYQQTKGAEPEGHPSTGALDAARLARHFAEQRAYQEDPRSVTLGFTYIWRHNRRDWVFAPTYAIERRLLKRGPFLVSDFMARYRGETKRPNPHVLVAALWHFRVDHQVLLGSTPLRVTERELRERFKLTRGKLRAILTRYPR